MGSMALEDAADQFPVDEETTVSELIDMYGEEAVRRGISYISNLADSEEKYLEAAQGGNYGEGITDAVVGGDVPEDKKDELDSKWEEGMQDSGLGLNDE